MPLENAIELYQKGMELSKLCSDKLQNAEKQLVSFMGENKEEVGQDDE